MELNRKWQRSDERQELQRKSMTDKPGWQKQEDLIEEIVPGGKKVPGSGCSSRRTRKGDVKGNSWLSEGKSTGKNSISIKYNWLRKIRGEAEVVEKKPMLVFGFDTCKNREQEHWMAIPHDLGKLLLGVHDAVLNGSYAEADRLAKILEEQ